MQTRPHGRVLLLMPRELHILSRFVAACVAHGLDCALLVHDRHAAQWRLVTYRAGEYVETASSTGDTTDALLRLLSGESWLGVVPTGEFSAQQAEYLAQALDLFHNPLPPVPAYRNKFDMRVLFGRQGIRQPRVLARFQGPADLDAFDWQSVAFPVIAKPIDLTSSMHVRLCHTEQEARKAFRRIFVHVQSFGGARFLGHGLLETYCSAPEFSAECVVADGRVVDLFVTTKFVSPLPACDEIGHVVGAPVSARHLDAAHQLAQGVVAGWQTAAGVLHVEYKFDGERAILMEAACRIGGDHIPELVELQYGCSLEAALIAARCPALGLAPQRRVVARGQHGVRFLFGRSRSATRPEVLVRRRVHYQRDAAVSAAYGIGDRLGYELLWSGSLPGLADYIGQDGMA